MPRWGNQDRVGGPGAGALFRAGLIQTGEFGVLPRALLGPDTSPAGRGLPKFPRASLLSPEILGAGRSAWLGCRAFRAASFAPQGPRREKFFGRIFHSSTTRSGELVASLGALSDWRPGLDGGFP